MHRRFRHPRHLPVKPVNYCQSVYDTPATYSPPPLPGYEHRGSVLSGMIRSLWRHLTLLIAEVCSLQALQRLFPPLLHLPASKH